MRHIVLDTETTGFKAEADDRIIEIGALELVNYVPTGKFFHVYINPQRDIPAAATAVHGITDEFVMDKPVYAEIVSQLDDFIGQDTLVIHNAEFDMRFLNAEYKRLGLPSLPMDRALDTLLIARKKFPGAPASLDALCKRFNIDLTSRTFHGALLDAQLLADVFLELVGGRQPELLGGGGGSSNLTTTTTVTKTVIEDMGKLWPVRNFALTAEERTAHSDMLAKIKEPLWLKD